MNDTSSLKLFLEELKSEGSISADRQGSTYFKPKNVRLPVYEEP